MSEPIPEPVLRFLDEVISSVEQLELLLLLRRTRDRSWTAQSASLELRTSPQSVQTRASELVARGIFRAEDGAFTYTADAKVDAVVGELERSYATYRTRVITRIFDKPAGQIRDFANAFRLRGNGL